MQIESVLEEDLRKIIRKMDKNGDGYIQYSEFIEEAHKICIMISDLYLKHAFDLFDLGDDLEHIGSIPINLVQSAMCNSITSKRKIQPEEWEDFVKKFDENND